MTHLGAKPKALFPIISPTSAVVAEGDGDALCRHDPLRLIKPTNPIDPSCDM
jgi:hypothetical protein